MSRKKIIILIVILLSLLAISPYFIGTLYNTWITNEESIQEDDFYQEEIIDDIYKEETKNTSWNLFFSTTHAIDNINTEQDFWKKVYFNDRIYSLLEKYYILWNLDLKNIPDDMFYYWLHEWDNFKNILNTYDYLNKTSKFKEYIEIQKTFRNKVFYEKNLKVDILQIIKDYSDNKKTLNINNVEYFPKEFIEDEWFKFMIDWLYNHPYLIKESERLWKLYWYDPDLTKAAILTEQFRYAWTYRGYVKQYLKKTPFLFSMTKWSYWIGGIKEWTWDKIIEDTKIYETYDVFKKQDYDLYKDYSKTDFLTDKYWEIVFPNMLISNIVDRWDKAWYPIEDKPWIILTLYNFWNPSDKKPHDNPKVWGASIKFFEDQEKTYTYSFWWLWESLFYFIKMNDYNIIRNELIVSKK